MKMNILILVTLSFMLSSSTYIFGQQPKFETKIPPEMTNLDLMVGQWENESEFYGPDGKIRGKQKFKHIVEPLLGGMVLKNMSYMITPEGGDRQIGETWIFYDSKKKEYKITAVDIRGNFDTFTSKKKEDRWVFINSPQPFKDKEIIWKRTYYDMTLYEHKLSMEYSLDGGKTWTLSNIQTDKKIKKT